MGSQDCNFFVAYEPERYHAPMTDVNIADLYPIHSHEEGDLFREWTIDHYSIMQNMLSLAEQGIIRMGISTSVFLN